MGTGRAQDRHTGVFWSLGCWVEPRGAEGEVGAGHEPFVNVLTIFFQSLYASFHFSFYFIPLFMGGAKGFVDDGRFEPKGFRDDGLVVTFGVILWWWRLEQVI